MIQQIHKWCIQAMQIGIRSLRSTGEAMGPLKEGFSFKNVHVVNENYVVNDSSDIIEKLKQGFMKFKEEEFKYNTYNIALT